MLLSLLVLVLVLVLVLLSLQLLMLQLLMLLQPPHIQLVVSQAPAPAHSCAAGLTRIFPRSRPRRCC